MRCSLSLLFLFSLVLALLGGSCVRADDDHHDNYKDKAAVLETLNAYMHGLNSIVEYGPGPTCDLTKVNAAALFADAANFVSTYFSPNFVQYLVYQSTLGSPNTAAPPVLNFTVAPPSSSANGQSIIQFPNSAALISFLQTFYGQLGYFFSPPFYWLLSAPVVTQIVERDPAFGHQKTAYVIANNENKGFLCAGSRIGYRIQESQYQHVFAYNHDANAWQFVRFVEVNKNQVTLNPAPIQNAP